jgi:hypothetical protein
MEQRTEEWFAARLGKVTASRVADVIAKTKSGYSASRDNYMAAKAMQGMMVDVERPRCIYIADTAYEMADAMLKAREA